MEYNTQQKWILGCIKNYNEQVPPQDRIGNPFVKNIIYMNGNNSHDFNFADANIQIQDKNLFSTDELPSIHLLNKILRNRIEMKNHDKSCKTKNLYIEYEQDCNGNAIFKPSGIKVSQSEYYFFNIGDIGLFLNTEFLKWMYNNKEELGLLHADNKKTGKDNITNAFLVKWKDIVDLQNKYKNFEKEQSIKRVREKLYKK